MKKYILYLAVFFIPMIFHAQHNQVIGKWKTIDDVTGKEIAIIEIYEKAGKIYGKVHDIFDAESKKKHCTNCTG
jgi:hypothetical protein